MRCDDLQTVNNNIDKLSCLFDCVLDIAVIRIEAGKLAQLAIYHDGLYIIQVRVFAVSRFRSVGLVYLLSPPIPRAAVN